jgi:hypothetical protein
MITKAPLPLFFLDKKKEAKKVKAIFLFSIRYNHVGAFRDGNHFLYLFVLPKFGSHSTFRKGKVARSAFADRFLICSKG